MWSLPPYTSMLSGMLPSQQSMSFSDHEGAPSALADLDLTSCPPILRTAMYWSYSPDVVWTLILFLTKHYFAVCIKPASAAVTEPKTYRSVCMHRGRKPRGKRTRPSMKKKIFIGVWRRRRGGGAGEGGRQIRQAAYVRNNSQGRKSQHAKRKVCVCVFCMLKSEKVVFCCETYTRTA